MQYYGNAEFWRALALINRAPNVDKIYPGEHVILPDAGTVAKIAAAQKLTEVNELVNNQQVLAVLESEQEAMEFTKNSAGPEEAMPTIDPPQPAAVENVETIASEGTEAEIPAAIQEMEAAGESEEYDTIVAARQDDSQNARTTSGLLWPITGVAAVLIAGFTYGYRRKKKNQIDGPEIDASPLKTFILEDEQNEKSNADTNDIVPASFPDDIFKPVRRRNEELQEQEVAANIQEG